MRKSDLLDAGLRILGAWLIIRGIEDGFAVIDILAGSFKPGRLHLEGYIWQTFAHIAVGMILFSKTPHFVRIAYKNPDKISDQQVPPG